MGVQVSEVLPANLRSEQGEESDVVPWVKWQPMILMSFLLMNPMFKIELHHKVIFHKAGHPIKLVAKPKHPQKVHVWAGISARGATSIVMFTGIMNATWYSDVLDASLVPFPSRPQIPARQMTRSIRANGNRTTSRIRAFTGGEHHLLAFGQKLSIIWYSKWSERGENQDYCAIIDELHMCLARKPCQDLTHLAKILYILSKIFQDLK